MNITTKGHPASPENLPRILRQSCKLDSDIYHNLTSILLNDLLLPSSSSPKKPAPNFPNSKPENISELTPQQLIARIETLENEKQKLCQYVTHINEERKNFKQIVLQMLAQKFWQIKLNKSNSDFFLNKLEGINCEILRQENQKLENLREEDQEIINEMEEEIDFVTNKRFELENELKDKNDTIKQLILVESRRQKTPEISKLASRKMSKRKKVKRHKTLLPPKKSSKKTLTKNVIKRRCSL